MSANPTRRAFSPAALREARQSAGLTATQLGAAIGVSTGAVNQWETGLRVPNGNALLRAALVLDVSCERLAVDS